MTFNNEKIRKQVCLVLTKEEALKVDDFFKKTPYIKLSSYLLNLLLKDISKEDKVIEGSSSSDDKGGLDSLGLM